VPAGAAGLGLDALNALDAAAFAAQLAGVFEHSAWIAEAAAAHRPFASVDALHAAMLRIVTDAPEAAQLALLRAHPELATRRKLTAESAAEQGGMGLDRLDDAEAERFATLNHAYQARFGFPFIIAVRGQRDRATIGTALAERLGHGEAEERATALAEVGKIALFRLRDLVREAP
jgi:2-oxo-4-hydroxy-4-carboxy-5-ureidoimidazoline decarboxylase